MNEANQQVNAKKLFLGSLPYSETEGQLRELFAPHGEIVELKVIMDRFTGQSKGIAFVEFSTEEQAQTAMKALHETQLDGRSIIVNIAKPMKPGADRFQGGNRGGGDYGNRGGSSRF